MRIPRGYVTTAEPAGVATGAPPLRKEVVEADDPAPYAFAAARVHARMPRSPTLDTAHRQAISSWQNGAAPVEASKSGRDERGLAYVGICVFLWYVSDLHCSLPWPPAHEAHAICMRAGIRPRQSASTQQSSSTCTGLYSRLHSLLCRLSLVLSPCSARFSPTSRSLHRPSFTLPSRWPQSSPAALSR